MADDFLMCPSCDHGILVSQVIEDNQNSERIECYLYSCGHNFGYLLENHFLIGYNPEKTYLYDFKIWGLKCNAKYENSSE